MLRLVWTPDAAATYEMLRAKAAQVFESRRNGGRPKPSPQEGLFKQVHKCLVHLAADPRHPGLQTHPYSCIPHPYDSRQKVFEAYAQQHTPGAYRVFWCYGPRKGEMTIIAITPHP
jgi:hypothetical protein